MLVRNTPTRATSSKLLPAALRTPERDRKSTRLNSSHRNNSYAVFCLEIDRSDGFIHIFISLRDNPHIDFGFLIRSKRSHLAFLFLKETRPPDLHTLPPHFPLQY